MKKTDRKSVNIKLTKTRNNLLNEDSAKINLAPEMDESCWDEIAKNSLSWIAVGAGYSILLGSHAEELVKTAFKGGTGAVSVSSAAVDAAVQFNAQRKSNGLYSAAKNNKAWKVSKDAASRTVLGALKFIYNMYAGLALGSFAKAKNLADMGWGKTSIADLGKSAAHGILGVKKGVISIVLMIMTWQGASRAWNGKSGAPTEKDNKDGSIVLAALKNLADIIISLELNIDWIIKTGGPFILNPSDPLGAPEDGASGTGGGLVNSNSKCFAMNSISSAIAARAVWHAIFAMATGKAGRALATAGSVKNAGQIEEVLKSTFKAAYRKLMDQYKVNAKQELNGAWADSLTRNQVRVGFEPARMIIDDILDDIILTSASSRLPSLESLGESLVSRLREIKNPEGAQLIADDVIDKVVGSFKKKVSEVANRSFNRNAKEAKKLENNYRETLKDNRAQAAQRVEALFRSHKAAAEALEAATSPASTQASSVMPAERAAVEAAEAVSTIRLQAALENLAKLGKGGTEAGDEVASLLAARLSDKVSKEIRIKLAKLIPETDASVDEILDFFRNIDNSRFNEIVKKLTELVNDARQADGPVADNVFDLFTGAPVAQSANIAKKVTGINELIAEFVKRITDPSQSAAATRTLQNAASTMRTKLAAAAKASPGRIAVPLAVFESILAMAFTAVLAVTKDEPDKTAKEVSALIRADDPDMTRVKNYMDFMLSLSKQTGDDKIDVEVQFDNFIISCINTLEAKKTDEKIASAEDFAEAAMKALDFSKDGCNFLEFLKKQAWFTQWPGKERFLEKNAYGELNEEQNKIIFTLITKDLQEIKSLAKAAWNRASGKGPAKFYTAMGEFKSKVEREDVLFSFEDWKSRIKSLDNTTKKVEDVKDVKESVISNKSELRSLVSDFLKENYGQGYAKYPYSSGQGESEEPREDYVQDWKALEIEIMRDKTRGAAIDLAKILVQDLELFNDVLDLAGQNQSIGSEILAKLRNNKDTEEDS